MEPLLSDPTSTCSWLHPIVPYNKSNRSGDLYLQILEQYLRSDAFVRKLNRDAASAANNATSGEHTIAASNGLKSMSRSSILPRCSKHQAYSPQWRTYTFETTYSMP